MKKVMLSLVVFCFLAPYSFAQTREEVKEEVRKEMKELRKELKSTFEDLEIELNDLDIDLSGLDRLKDIDWDFDFEDDEGMAYLKSEEFKKEMNRVQEEVDKAIEKVRIELDNIDWDSINKTIDDAMKQVEKELSNIKKKDD